jgi:hypothetical protein
MKRSLPPVLAVLLTTCCVAAGQLGALPVPLMALAAVVGTSVVLIAADPHINWRIKG